TSKQSAEETEKTETAQSSRPVEEKTEEVNEETEKPVVSKTEEESAANETVSEPTEPEDVQEPVSSGKEYIVQPGDNLFRIALNHNMTTEQLRVLNGLPSNDIKVGDVLKVE